MTNPITSHNITTNSILAELNVFYLNGEHEDAVMVRIAVEGNIGSGKSSALAALALAFPDVPTFPEPVDEWTDLLQLFYSSPAEWALAFSLKVLLTFREPGAIDTCIVERSPLASRHVFSQILYNDGSLMQQEWELFKEYHDLMAWKPDVFIYVDTPVHACLDRIRERGRPGESVIDEQYLRRIEFQYANMLRYVNIPVVKVDGTLPQHELHAAIQAAVQKILEP